MTVSKPPAAMVLVVASLVLSAFSASHAELATDMPAPEEGETILVQYLEIVTPDVDATCSSLEEMHGVSFGTPVAGFGNARTAALEGGGMIGVRAPMRESEHPVVRPYVLVDDIQAAIESAAAAGAEIAMPPMEIPGHGKFAIYILGGIEHGLWQN